MGLSAQDTTKYKTIADELFKDKGEIYFSVQLSDSADMHRLTKIISIDHCAIGEGNGLKKEIKAYANKKQFYRFLQLNYPYTILPSPGSLIQPQMMELKDFEKAKTRGLNTTYPAYPTYQAYEQLMAKYASNYPSICKLVNIKTLPSGRKLLLLKISDNINNKENEPQFLYTSSMHGDEVTGYPLMLDLIDNLLSNYNNNARITNLVNNIEIWICPLANPDGTYKSGNNTVSGATRSNSNNIDLNRNYPDPKGGIHPDGEQYQPETLAFMGFADTMSFVMAANFHGGAEVVNYPWDTWSKAPPDVKWWTKIGKYYADSARLSSPGNNYLDDLYSGNIKGVTQGFPWYEVEGGRQDYMNYFKNCRELTIELSATKILAESNLDAHWNYNRRSLLNFMEESLKGIRGIVSDECTGKPIKAKVNIPGLDADNSFVYSTSHIGNYHRPIYQGTYTLEFSAAGYVTKTISGIIAPANGITLLNVQLKPQQVAKPLITQNNGTLYSSAASGNQWFLNGAPINGASGIAYTPQQAGLYTVSSSACGTGVSDPYSFQMVGITAIETSNNDLKLFPNPGNGTFYFQSNKIKSNEIEVEVINMQGEIVMNRNIHMQDENTFEINISHQPDGLYLLKIKADRSFYTSKIVLHTRF